MFTRRAIDTSDGLLEPSIPPPFGVVADLANPPNWQWATIFAMVLYIVTTTVFILIRMYTRIKIHAKLWWDDFCMVLGWVGLLVFASLVLESLKFGNATDEWNVSKTHAAHLKQLFSTIEIIARLGIFFTKTSILLLYIRYFCPRGTGRTAIWWWTWAVIITNLLYCISLILTVTLQCVGRPRKPGQSCVNSWAVLIGASVINVLTDLIMLAIPISAVWNLHVAKARKVGLWFMFSFASLAVIASVARLGYQIPQAKSPNQTILITYVGILALAEHAIGIIVGCMPLIPSFYSHIRKRCRSVLACGDAPHGDPRWPAYPPQRKVRSKNNDTIFLATENTGHPDVEKLKYGYSDVSWDHVEITAIGTRKLSMTSESSSEPKLPPEARLHNDRHV